ncbi:uncharacterized protein PSFLO_04961 [Pseudozyma flocculosa]|uniref:Uncharacterized protein n=1 Tax=Pseudozyma flocculosa TaxID=84751 RepID=A0A5C3F5S6_9BASI|nr:uncharacterized protein PSFLO_04961 [Pseudozyma flocculosa]
MAWRGMLLLLPWLLAATLLCAALPLCLWFGRGALPIWTLLGLPGQPGRPAVFLGSAGTPRASQVKLRSLQPTIDNITTITTITTPPATPSNPISGQLSPLYPSLPFTLSLLATTIIYNRVTSFHSNPLHSTPLHSTPLVHSPPPPRRSAFSVPTSAVARRSIHTLSHTSPTLFGTNSP